MSKRLENVIGYTIMLLIAVLNIWIITILPITHDTKGAVALTEFTALLAYLLWMVWEAGK